MSCLCSLAVHGKPVGLNNQAGGVAMVQIQPDQKPTDRLMHSENRPVIGREYRVLSRTAERTTRSKINHRTSAVHNGTYAALNYGCRILRELN